MKQFAFLSGIPRSGSQVLCSVLNQHPLLYASTTSPLADLLLNFNEVWPAISQAIVDRDINQQSNMIRGLINSTYEHIDTPYIIDKNRIWPRLVLPVKNALKQKPKIIFTVRNIPEVISSYILLIRKNSHKVTFIDEDLNKLNLPVNDKNRCKIIWEKYLNHPYTSLRIGLNSNDCEKLILDYYDIVNNTQYTFDRVCDFLEIERHSIQTTELKSMDENDAYHGGMDGLHHVRPVMQKTSPPPEEIIGHELTHLYTNMNLEFWKKYTNQQNTL